jgi:hypothetical protein
MITTHLSKPGAKLYTVTVSTHTRSQPTYNIVTNLMHEFCYNVSCGLTSGVGTYCDCTLVYNFAPAHAYAKMHRLHVSSDITAA